MMTVPVILVIGLACAAGWLFPLHRKATYLHRKCTLLESDNEHVWRLYVESSQKCDFYRRDNLRMYRRLEGKDEQHGNNIPTETAP